MLQRAAIALLYCFVASIPVDQIPVEGIGSPSVGVGAVAGAVGVLAILQGSRVRRLNVVHRLLVGFVIWAAFSAMWALDQDAAVQRTATFFQLLVLVVLMWQLGRDAAAAESIATAYVGGAMVAALATVYAFWRGSSFGTSAERYAGFGYDPNDLSVTLAIGVVLAWFVFSRCTGVRRTVALVYVPVALLAVLLSGSRTGALASVCALAVVPISTKRMNGPARIVAFLVMAISVIVLMEYAPGSAWERIATTKEEMLRGTMSERTAIWNAGWTVLAENWLVGVGVGSFGAAARPYLGFADVAHNTALEIAAELGVPGTVLFFGAWAVLAVRARRLEPHVRYVAWFLMLTWVIGAMSLSWEFRKYTWFVLAFDCHLVAAFAPARLARGSAPSLPPLAGAGTRLISRTLA